MRSMKLTLFLLIVLCVGGSLSLWAQASSSGTVVGTVADPSGAVVNGATVTLLDKATNSARTATTNDAGRYIFVKVPPGTSDVTITKQRYATIKTSQVEAELR